MKTANIKLTINNVEYACYSKKLELVPDTEDEVLCTTGGEDSLTVEMLITYGNTGTYNLLSALAGTVATHIVQPLNATTASVSNPKWTFSALVPRIPKLIAEPGKTGSFEYSVTSQGGVTQVTA